MITKPKSVDQMDPPSVVEASHDEYGENVEISQLPDLCILEVCRHLTRLDIFNFSLTNSRMYQLANERCLDDIKWKGGYLIVEQTERGYGFMLDVIQTAHTSGRNNKWTKYEYEVIKNRRGELEEIRSRNTHKKDISLFCWEHRPHSWPIPEQLCSTLDELLRQREVTGIDADGLQLSFCSYLDQAMDLSKMKNLDWAPIRDEVISSEDRMRFVNFIKNFLSVDLETGQNIINVEFIREVKGGRMIRFSSGIFLMDGIDKEDHKLSHFFYPDQSIFPFLLGYEEFFVPTMIIRVTWLARFSMMYLESLSNPFHEPIKLQFSIDRVLTSEHITRFIRDSEYEYFFDPSANHHYVNRMADGSKVRISVVDYTVEGQVINGIWMYIYGSTKNGIN